MEGNISANTESLGWKRKLIFVANNRKVQEKKPQCRPNEMATQGTRRRICC